MSALKAAQALHDLFQPGMGTNFVQELVPKVAEIIDRETGLGELVDAADKFLEWSPTCSVGSSGYIRAENLRTAIAKA